MTSQLARKGACPRRGASTWRGTASKRRNAPGELGAPHIVQASQIPSRIDVIQTSRRQDARPAELGRQARQSCVQREGSPPRSRRAISIGAPSMKRWHNIVQRTQTERTDREAMPQLVREGAWLRRGASERRGKCLDTSRCAREAESSRYSPSFTNTNKVETPSDLDKAPESSASGMTSEFGADGPDLAARPGTLCPHSASIRSRNPARNRVSQIMRRCS